MKALLTVAAAAIAASIAILASSHPAEATHKPNCGKRWVETGYVYGSKEGAIGKIKAQCKAELLERGKYTYGANFTGIEKFSAHCVLQTPGDPISKFWCVCSGEPCWKLYTIKKPADFDFRMGPLPPGGLRSPSRTGPSFRDPRRR